MARFCMNCGKQLNDAVKFCASCGAQQQPAPQPAPAQSAQPQQQPQPYIQPQYQYQQPYAPTPKKKSKTPFIVGSIVGVLVIVLVIVLISTNVFGLFGSGGGDNPNDNTNPPDVMGSLTKDIFNTLTSGTYHMKLQGLSGDAEGFEVEIYAKGGVTAMLLNSEGVDIRTVTKSGKTYAIIDAQKIIVIQDADPANELAFMGTISKLIYVGEGSGDFNGNTYKYDEYKNSNGARFFYFVDGGVFKGLRTIADGETAEVAVNAFDKNVPDSVFVIPNDYEVTDLSSGDDTTNTPDMSTQPPDTSKPTDPPNTTQTSGTFQLKVFQGYDFSTKSVIDYGDMPDSVDIKFFYMRRYTLSGSDLGDYTYIKAVKIKEFENKPTGITVAQVDEWADFVMSPIPISGNYYFIQSRDGRYYLLHLTEVENAGKAIALWVCTFEWQEISIN